MENDFSWCEGRGKGRQGLGKEQRAQDEASLGGLSALLSSTGVNAGHVIST